MADIQKGDILFLKTTGEPVQVLDPNYPGNPAVTQVAVRRPVATRDNGILHLVDYFQPFELETDAEKLSRTLANDYAEYNRQMKLVEMTSPKPALAAEKVN